MDALGAVGNNPIPPPRQRSVEETNLGLAREAYAMGELTLEEFEASATHVLEGGLVNTRGRPLAPGSIPPPADPHLVRHTNHFQILDSPFNDPAFDICKPLAPPRDPSIRSTR